MGVPKFYRWISERYPCLSEVVKEFQLPEFDNLYLDMNGVVHVCSHPEDDNPHFRITEEQIFKDICHYIEFLFRMIKPRKVFFMAIDGVAPRAKMNQQRGRRFRSAREAEELIRKAQEKGETLPTEKRFDSNCITPGTPFMVRLQDHLKYFVVNKVTHDPLWQGPKIILSGHETPGEGEHKVMDFIRYSRSQPGHDPNTRHCLYGLDADLIMLGLTSHEPHFALLREEVRFGGRKDRNKRPATPEETTFHLLHLSLMREYLDYEFSPLKTTLPFAYDLERVIDDWILMGFLVGNDFIPHLPHLHIHHDALPRLWDTYMKVLPTLDGYLNEGGHLNLQRFEKYIGALSQFDEDQFREQFVDMKFLEGKRTENQRDARTQSSGGRRNGPNRPKPRGDSSFALLEGLNDMDAEYDPQANGRLEAHLASSFSPNAIDLSVEDDFDTFDAEFSAHKRDYYMTKLEYENVTPEVMRSQAYEYVRAIQWILLYYYEGVQSWSWYFPHHYAPYISDVRDFATMEMNFDMSEPFKPFEQLMAVLPAASKELLPEPMQLLMTEDSSPVIDYYPVNFKSDLNGKQQDWEAVVLIPFIDETRLLGAMRTKEPELTAEQRGRNSHGPCYLYQHSPELQGTYPSSMPGVFPDVAASHAKVCEIPKLHFCLAPALIKKGLMPETRLDVYFPGFPTLKNIPHNHRLDKCGVKVFQNNSRSFNMMLSIRDIPQRALGDIANELLGQTTWVGWPHLHEAKVYAVADERQKIDLVEQPKKGQATPVVSWNRMELTKPQLDVLYKDAASIKEKYHDRFGVEVGKTAVVIYAGTLTGRKYVYTSNGKVTAEKQFSASHVPFALQATNKDVLTHAADDMHFRTMDELFPTGAAVFMLGNPQYGCQGEVLEIDNKEGRVRVSFNVLQEPDFSEVHQGQQSENKRYMQGYIGAQQMGISKQLLARVTGTILIMRGDGGNPESKANIGLNLKFTKRGEEIPGYTRKTDDGWLYSDKCLKVIEEYLREFGDLWDYIASSPNGNSDLYTETELFPEESGKTLKECLKYLAQLPCSQVASMKSGANIVEDATVTIIEKAVADVAEVNKRKQKRVKMQVKPHLLFRPLPNQGTLEPDPGSTFEMLDRVVVVKVGYSVPFGLRGTVVGVHPGDTPRDTMLDVVFDQEFVGGILLRCSTKRGYRVPPMSVICLTHGETKKTGRVSQQQAPAQPPRNPWQQQNHHHHQQQQQQQQQGYGYQGNRQGQGQGSYSSLARQEGGSGGQGQWPMVGSQMGSQVGPRQGGYSMIAQRQDGGRSQYSQPHGQAPQFVTPKMQQPSSPRDPPSAPPNHPRADNSDFTKIWNQLLQNNTTPTGGTSNSSSGGGGNKKGGAEAMGSPIFGAASLQSAAEKLGKIAPPTSCVDFVEEDDDEDYEPPTGILVDLSEAAADPAADSSGRTAGERLKSASPATGKGKTSDSKGVKTRVVVKTSRSQPKSQAGSSSSSSSSNKKKGNVMELFANAEKARKSKSPSQLQGLQSQSPSQVQAKSKSPSDPEGSPPTTAQPDIVQAMFSQAAASMSSQAAASMSSQAAGSMSSQAAQQEQVWGPESQVWSQEGPAAEDRKSGSKSPEVQSQRVQALFEHVQSVQQSGAHNTAAPGVSAPGSSDLNSLFAALQMAPPPPQLSTSPSNLGALPPTSSASEDGSAALRQMLKIGVGDSQSSVDDSQSSEASVKNYGRQVSLQELFAGAKQAPPPSKSETAADSQASQQQPGQGQFQQQQQQQQQQQVHLPQALPHPLLPPPSLLNTPAAQGQGWNQARNPGEDLAVLCQMAGQTLPKYDFKFHPKQKGCIGLVTIPGGARFEGSLSSSQEEAAASAAGMAMLCLQQAQVQPPGQQGMPWMQRPGQGMGPPKRLFSPNSAFSPVANPLMRFGPPMFNQPPPCLIPAGQRGRQPLLSQPPPPFPPNRGPQPLPHTMSAARVPFSQAPSLSANQGQPPHPGPANHNASLSDPRHGANQAEGDKGGRDGSAKSSTEAFIPMQVTRKQRRKEDTPEKQASEDSTDRPPASKPSDTLKQEQGHPAQSVSPGQRKSSSKSPSVPPEDSLNNNPQSTAIGSLSQASPRQQKSTPKGKDRDVASGGASSESKDQGSEGKGKKRRSRLAANFNPPSE